MIFFDYSVQNFENLLKLVLFDSESKIIHLFIMTTRFIILTLVLLSTFLVIFGQIVPQSEPNYDENNVPEFELPDPLTTFAGKKIKTPREWIEERRPELLAFFSENVYGKVQCKTPVHQWEVVEQSDNALDGKACRKQVDLIFKKDNHALRFTILMYLPKKWKAPLFLGYNFTAIIQLPTIECSDIQCMDANNESLGIVNHQLTEASRGVRANRWPVEKIIHAGYGLATIFYCEVDPDRDDFSDGIHPFCYVEGQQSPAADEWGSISAWAWGLSRAMDYFEQDKDVDASKVIVFGHSRLGKTALWAGAQDERFSAVISNNSGCGGAALSKRRFGETIARINTAFPHWFCKNFNKYNDNEDALPVDQHELIALIAPRPVYVASAEKDLWADPRENFQLPILLPRFTNFWKKEYPLKVAAC